MAHDATCMSLMEHPSQRFGEIVAWVDHTRDMTKDDVALLLPFLDSKVLNINVSRTIGGGSCIDDLDCRHVVLTDRRWLCL